MLYSIDLYNTVHFFVQNTCFINASLLRSNMKTLKCDVTSEKTWLIVCIHNVKKITRKYKRVHINIKIYLKTFSIFFFESMYNIIIIEYYLYETHTFYRENILFECKKIKSSLGPKARDWLPCTGISVASVELFGLHNVMNAQGRVHQFPTRKY